MIKSFVYLNVFLLFSSIVCMNVNHNNVNNNNYHPPQPANNQDPFNRPLLPVPLAQHPFPCCHRWYEKTATGERFFVIAVGAGMREWYVVAKKDGQKEEGAQEISFKDFYDRRIEERENGINKEKQMIMVPSYQLLEDK